MNVFDGRTLVSAIRKVAHGFKFTRWEKKFMADVERQLDQGFKLSQKQGKSLQGIYRKVNAEVAGALR